MKYGNRLSIY